MNRSPPRRPRRRRRRLLEQGPDFSAFSHPRRRRSLINDSRSIQPPSTRSCAWIHRGCSRPSSTHSQRDRSQQPQFAHRAARRPGRRRMALRGRRSWWWHSAGPGGTHLRAVLPRRPATARKWPWPGDRARSRQGARGPGRCRQPPGRGRDLLDGPAPLTASSQFEMSGISPVSSSSGVRYTGASFSSFMKSW